MKLAQAYKANITSHNKAVKVRRLSAARLHKTMFGLRPLHGFVPPHFACPANCFAVCLFGQAKRLLPPNVVRHFAGYAKGS